MTRDADVLRAILEMLEGLEGPFEAPSWEELASEHGENEVLYNTALLRDEGYIRVVDNSTAEEASQIQVPDSQDSLGAGRLTWKGHELLAQFRSSKFGPEITF